ncbi:hypothetical protein ATKI12_2458 [Kitasatospora sp. Ki12]|uniref:hypothetical protein n=1 Tax=Kitasatospora xanthocidica TaxID=83382 RepID=UPI00167672B1|nr:hypothetical protein [Kitasatospora xanthocidica]GHF48666.1 hypothetical protein GCM10018790_27990 [Kitasatospora xanthocidica]
MSAPAPGTDGPSARPHTAQHYSLAPAPASPEGYVAPGMPGAPVTGYEPVEPAPRTAPRRRTALAVALAALAVLVGGLAYGCAPLRAADSLGWLAIAPAGLVALPLGRLGGRNRLLPPLGALLAAGALLLGQLTEHLRRVHADGPGPRGLLHDTLATWRADLRPLDAAFYAIAVIGGFLLTRRAADRG